MDCNGRLPALRTASNTTMEDCVCVLKQSRAEHCRLDKSVILGLLQRFRNTLKFALIFANECKKGTLCSFAISVVYSEISHWWAKSAIDG